MASPERLVVALLAAGRSSRFGAQDKLGAMLGGKPLIQWSAQAGLAIDAAQHLVVTGPDSTQQILPTGYRVLPNKAPGEGLASSLRLAARHAREGGASALLVLLADMPLVTSRHLRVLVSAFEAAPSRPLFSRIPGGTAQPPAILPAASLPALEALTGDIGARSLARDAAFIEADADTLIDVDTPADLARCAALLGA